MIVDRDGTEICVGDTVIIDGNTTSNGKAVVTSITLIDDIVGIKESFPGSLVIHSHVSPSRLRVKVTEDPKEFIEKMPV